MPTPPFVTIAMPCLNEEGYIEECLRSVLAQDYPKDRMEILVVDGMSIDATREIIAKVAAEDPRIRVIDNPDRIQSAGMNRAIKQAKGDVIVRMDVHCEYQYDYVSQCIKVLERTGADNVGGAARAKAKGLFQRALCAALDSPLGVGNAKYRNADAEGFVDTVCFGAFRRRVFETVGMFDPRAITNEDAEINQRILEAGGKIYLSRDIVVHYFPRESYRALAKQYFKYGKGRARTLLKLGKFPTLRPVLPFLMTAGGALLAATSSFHPFTLPAFGAYALVTGVEAIRVGRKAGLAAIPIVWGIFPVLHVSHGLGFAVGLVTYKLNPDWEEPERIPHAPAESSARLADAS
jgi:glycosyltransferase involved in cell wall biosynthesis